MPEVKVKKKLKPADEPKPGLFARLKSALTRSESADDGTDTPPKRGVDGLLAAGSRVLTGTIVLTLLGSWVFGRAPLERHVASLHIQPPSVVIQWPHLPPAARAAATNSQPRTWIPANVRHHLETIVRDHLSADPFDQAALVRAADHLNSTGWFERLDAVRRNADRTVTVTGQWRVPAAVVRKDGAEHLVALDGAILELPPGAAAPDRLFFINNPASPAPRNDAGEVAKGTPWLGNDVQAAIALLKLLHNRPDVSRQVGGVDLTEYGRAAKLVLVSNKGHRIVWGSPIGDLLPGEVSVERKVARLVQNLKDFGRIDADQPRMEIYTPVVLVDKTAAAIDGATASNDGEAESE